MKKIQVRDNKTRRVCTLNTLPTKTQQQHKDECDVNQIIAKYKKGEGIRHMSNKQGIYTDLSYVQDYATALQTVIDAQSAFDALPSKIRTKFNNNPSEMIQFISDPKNKNECVSLGIFQSTSTSQSSTPNSQSTSTSQSSTPNSQSTSTSQS